MSAFTDVLANIIRTVDGKHDLGAGELAERIEVELAKAGIAITQVDRSVTEYGVDYGDGDPIGCSSVERAKVWVENFPGDATICARERITTPWVAAAASIPTKETPK